MAGAKDEVSISCGDWTIRHSSTKRTWSAFNKGKPVIVDGDALIGMVGQRKALSCEEYSANIETASFEDELGKGKELKAILTDNGNWMDAVLSLRLYENKAWITARVKLKNTSGKSQILQELDLLRFGETGGLYIGNPLRVKYMRQGWAMDDTHRIYPLEKAADGEGESSWSPLVMALAQPGQR